MYTSMYPDMSTEMSSFRTAARELLFVYDFDLLIDYLAGKPVDRDVHPVLLLASTIKLGKRLRSRP